MSVSNELAAKTNESEFALNLNQRVLIDGRKILDGGIGRYIINLVDGLIKFTNCNVALICRPQDRVIVENHFGLGAVTLIESNIKPYSINELFMLGKSIHWPEFDLFHVPHFTLPYNVPIPTVVTVHDLIQITHPQKWYYPIIASFYLKHTTKRASRLIAVSSSTATEIAKRYPVNSKLTVVPNSCGVSNFSNHDAKCSISGIKAGYLLAVVSNSKPHKGIARLLKAYQTFRERYNQNNLLPEYGLIVVGDGAPSSVFPGGIGVGAVSEAELTWYYKNCRSLVIASDVEGFCLPVIEARAHGKTFVSTPVPAIKELSSSYDQIADDFSPESLANALYLQLTKELPDTSTIKNLNDDYLPERVILGVCKVYQSIFNTK